MRNGPQRLVIGGFCLLIAMMILAEVGAIRAVNSIADITRGLHEHPMAVSIAVMKVNADIISMHRYMKDVALAESAEELELAVSTVNKLEVGVHQRFDFILARFLGDKTRIEQSRKLFTLWKPIRAEVIELLKLGEKDAAASITKNKGANHVAKLTREMEDLIEFTETKANEFLLNSIEVENNSKIILYGLMSLILVVGLIVAFYVVRSVNRQSKDLMESEQRFRSISTSSITTIIIVADQSGNIIIWNPAAEKSFGYTEAEILNRPITDIMPARYRAAHLEGLHYASDLATNGMAGKVVDLIGLKKNGEEFAIDLSLSSWEQGEHRYFSAIIHDISERKEAEVARNLAATTFESHEAIAITDKDSNILRVNRAFTTITGYKESEVIGRNPRILSSGYQDAEFYRHMRTKLLEEGAWSGEIQNRRRNGDVFPVQLSITAVEDRNGKVTNYVGHITDMTEIKEKEVALNHALRMETIGQLTGGISHDFNNLLSIIKGNLRFLQEDIGRSDPDLDELFEDAMSAVDDGAALTGRLLGFSRSQALLPKIANINDVIESFVRFMSRTIGENIVLDFTPPEAEMMISVDPAQLDTALLNLCLNARDAMPEGGMITIIATPYHHDENDRHDLILAAGSYIKVSVTDIGSGILEEDLEHVCEPFFTTKEVGKGSGLGLSMVYGFSQQSNGACQICSTPGEGTTVSMYFPERQGEGESVEDVDEREGDVASRSEVVLVVEDEPRVRRVTLRDLKRLGYRTLGAANAAAAKTLIESGEPVDLLLTDILMPGDMDGHMLAVWTEENYPHIKVLLISGYRRSKTGMDSDQAHHFPMIKKPYSIEKLSNQIRSELG